MTAKIVIVCPIPNWPQFHSNTSLFHRLNLFITEQHFVTPCYCQMIECMDIRCSFSVFSTWKLILIFYIKAGKSSSGLIHIITHVFTFYERNHYNFTRNTIKIYAIPFDDYLNLLQNEKQVN